MWFDLIRTAFDYRKAIRQAHARSMASLTTWAAASCPRWIGHHTGHNAWSVA